MEQTGNAAIRKRFLKWIINATLVLSVITFSGNVPQSKSFSSEPTQTEFRQTGWTDREKAVRFTTNHDLSGHSKCFDRAKNFCFGLFQRECQIAVKLKDNRGNRTNNAKLFLIHFFNYNPEESDTDEVRV